MYALFKSHRMLEHKEWTLMYTNKTQFRDLGTPGWNADYDQIILVLLQICEVI